VQQSSGLDCFGADASNPACAPAHGKPAPAAPPPRPPMDLVWTKTDAMGFPLNPQWAWQTTNPGAPDIVSLCGEFQVRNDSIWLGDPPCTTTRISADAASNDPVHISGEPFGLCDSSIKGAQGGHVNWGVVSYTGRVRYHSHETSRFVLDGPWEDGDYNIELYPDGGGGLSAGEPNYILVEFKDAETVDHFTKGIWPDFESSGASHIDGQPAIITGLFGADGVHGFDTELHPAYLFAVQTRPYGDELSKFEVWDFFVRNWGNEGMCSHLIWGVNQQTWVVKIPWRGGVNPAVTVDAATNGPTLGYFFRSVPGDGIYVTFLLPPYTAKARVNGEISIDWHQNDIPGLTNGPTLIPPLPPLMRRIEKNPSAEERLEEVMERLESQQPAAKPQPPAPDRGAVRAVAASAIARTRSFSTSAKGQPLLSTQRDPSAIPVQTRAHRLCIAAHNQVPEFPGLCPR
jgi:hypothetical protein